MNDTVDPEYFPFTVEPVNASPTKSVKTSMFSSSAAVVVPDPYHPYSLRTTRAKWSNAKKDNENDNTALLKDSSLPNSVEYRKNGQTIVLFVLGGMTYSEIRSCYEVMNDYKRDIIIGKYLVGCLK